LQRIWADQGHTGGLIPWAAHQHGVRLESLSTSSSNQRQCLSSSRPSPLEPSS
jgi:hypothetical protein